MNKYRQLAEKVKEISKEIVGMSIFRAEIVVRSAGLQFRVVEVDGQGAMITADCRMDRIGFVVKDGKIIGTRNG